MSLLDEPAFDVVLTHLDSLDLVSYEAEIPLLQLYTDCLRASISQTPDVLPSEALALINRSSCHFTHITMQRNLGSMVEWLHRSLGSASVCLTCPMVQRIARRELTLPHLRRVFCAKCKNASGSAVEDFEENVIVLFQRLSMED